jgi:integrase
MASIQKTAKGYRAQVYVQGVRDSQVFRTQREAKAWADSRTLELRASATRIPQEKYTLADAVDRYLKEESPKKRGFRWENIRFTAMLADKNFPSGELMGNLGATHFSTWRDARLKQVQAGSVLREIALVSALLEVARVEWRWIGHNPIKDIAKPRMPDHREVVIQPVQVRRMLRTMGYSPARPIRTVAQSVSVCFLTALRTGMRAGELCGLTWGQVFDDYCHLPVTKTSKRDVPLTKKAVRLVRKMEGYDPRLVFGMNSRSLDANFRKYRNRAGLSGFTFHDSRHTAATMLSRKLDVMDLCRMFGWTTTKHALIYYNPTASSIAGVLNGAPGRPR